MRNAVQEVGGAVERIDDPAIGLVGAFNDAALFHHEAVAGARLGEFFEQRLLGFDVGGGDEIARPLARDLQILDLAEIARQRARRLARGGDHHVHQGGESCGMVRVLAGGG